MSSIFDLAEVEFKFTGNNTAALSLGDAGLIPIVEFQVYQSLQGYDLRVRIVLGVDLPPLPATFELRHTRSSTLCKLVLDDHTRNVAGIGVGTRQLDAIPASRDDHTILLQLLKRAASILEDCPPE
jgi:hypothetical protein